MPLKCLGVGMSTLKFRKGERQNEELPNNKGWSIL